MALETQKCRHKMLHMINRWHAYAREQFDKKLVDAGGDFVNMTTFCLRFSTYKLQSTCHGALSPSNLTCDRLSFFE